MFGEYAQIATYLQQTRDGTTYNDNFQDPLPSYLHPPFQPSQPWATGKDKAFEDFILVAEFSELEGPKPVMTIPKDGGSNFDQNSFSVRILAVDHQTSSTGFTITEDAQVVLSDVDTGVFAFVHHLVLFDNTARGFVRPYCIAYVTMEPKKLMHFYEEISLQLKKVARFLKYGNKLLFIGDLERHLKDLEYTKGFLLNQVSKMRLKDVDTVDGQAQDTRKNAENELYRGLQTIRQSSSEIKEILSTLKPLLSDRRLENRFRLLEERAFQKPTSSSQDKLSLQENWFNDLSSLEELDLRCGSLNESRMSPLTLFKPREYKPVLVETKKAKRFNAPLRGLHELCSWGAKEGLRKLRHIHEYFKRDLLILEMEKNESRLFRPCCGKISHGQCITGNFFTGVHVRQSQTSADEDNGSLFYNYQWGTVGSLESIDSFKSVDSSLYGFDTSPSSMNTYESARGFHSAASSPPDINLLMENEYYEDIEAAEDQMSVAEMSVNFDLLEREDTTLEDSTENLESSELPHLSTSLKPGTDSVWENFSEGLVKEGEGRIPDHSSETEVQFRSQVANLQSNLSILSFGSISDLHFPDSTTATATSGASHNKRLPSSCDLENVLNKKLSENFHLAQNLNSYKNHGLPSENIDPEGSSYGRDSQNVPEQDARVVEKNNNVGSKDNTAVLTGNSSPTNLMRHETQDNPPGNPRPLTLAGIKSNNSVSTHQSCPDQDGGETSKNKIIVSSDNSPCQHFIVSADISLDISDIEAVMREKDGLTIEDNTPKRDSTSKLTSMLEQAGCVATVTSTPTPSRQISANEVSSSEPETPKESFHTASESHCSSSSSKLSSVSQTNPPAYAHQVTGVNNPRVRQKIVAVEEDMAYSVQSCAESETSSAFTEISMRDMFPHLVDQASGSSRISQVRQDSFDGIAGGDYIDEYLDIQMPVNTRTWKPRCGLYTVGDWINNLAPGRPGSCLLEVLFNYQHIHHVIFSLLSGRPVLVAGSSKFELEVTKLVNALSVFVPATKRKRQTVLEWTTKPLKIVDITKLKLVGVCRPERRTLDSYIPGAIKKSCTVLDVERRLITAVPYQGHWINFLMAKKKVFKNDIQLLSFIEWWMMCIMAKSFIFFHSFCLSSTGSILYSHSPKDQRDTYCSTVSNIMTRIGIKDCDSEIIEYLTEMVKISRLESQVWQGVEPGNVVQPLHLQYKPCQIFRC